MPSLLVNPLPAQYAQRILQGLSETLKIALLSVLFSLLLGMLFGTLLAQGNKIVRIIGRIYIETMRIIPILVWLFIFYFGVAKQVSVSLSSEFVSILVFTLWGTAEMGDIVRGALESLSRHQVESGLALGLGTTQLYCYILLPQAFRRILPQTINLITRMVKTASLCVFIGVVELVKVGQQIIEVSERNFPTASLWVYGIIFGLYFMVCWPISLLATHLEKKTAYGRT